MLYTYIYIKECSKTLISEWYLTKHNVRYMNRHRRCLQVPRKTASRTQLPARRSQLCVFHVLQGVEASNIDHRLYNLRLDVTLTVTVGLPQKKILEGFWQKSVCGFGSNHHHHHHKHQGLDPMIRSVSRATVARANASSVFQLFSFLVVCSGMISKGFGFVAFFASVKVSSVCIHLSYPVCL